MTRWTRDAQGSTLVLNLFVMAVFAMMAVIVYKSAKSMVGEAVYYERSAQALSIAEAGAEDAMHALYSTATWRTGFTSKPFAGGYYTVTVTTASATSLFVVSSGYSPSVLFLGRAVKTVSFNVLFISSSNPTNAVLSSNLTVNGTVDAYDPRVSLTPTTFGPGGTIWADTVDTGGNCTSPAVPRILSDVIVYNAAAPAVPPPPASPGSGCVNPPPGTIPVTSTNVPVSLPLHSCDATCQSLAAGYNLNLNTLNPVVLPYAFTGSQSNPNNPTLTVGVGQTVTMSSGTYYFKDVTINQGVLNVDTTAGPVNIFYTNSFSENDTSSHHCAVNNLSMIPSKLLIADVGGGHTVTLQCPSPLHAYLEDSSHHFDILSGQEVYGHFSGVVAIIEAGAKLHFDLSAGVPATHLTWSTGPSGSWTESYKRQ